MVLFLGSIESLHLLTKNLIHVSHVDSLVGELGGEGGELISEDSDLTLEVISLFLEFGETLTDLSQLSLLTSDVRFKFLVVFLFSVKLLLVVLEIRAFLVKEVLR